MGEAPGKWEDNTGKPFQGDSGQELDKTYLPLAGLDRRDVRVTNVVRCRPEGNKTPGERLVTACSRHHLPAEIAQCDPGVIILLGATACSLFPTISLEVEHGRPFYVDASALSGTVFDGWSGWIVPMYHPASGLHDTRMMQPMLEDWKYLGDWRKREDDDRFETEATYYGCNDNAPAMGHGFDLAVDLESVNGKVWSIQLCNTQGMVAMYTMDWLLNDFVEHGGSYLSRLCLIRELLSGGTVYLHNAPGDLLLLDQLGVDTQKMVYIDTMQCVYHHQNLPQGLKALGYRLFGIRMMEYNSLVIPYSKRALDDWMTQALIVCENDLRWVELKQLKTKVKEITHVSHQEKSLHRILSHSLDKETYDPWERLADLNLGPVVDVLGPYPTPSIEHVPERLAINYACQDADVTLRLGSWLDNYNHLSSELDINVHDIDKV